MLFAALLAFVVVVEVSALADSREVFRTAIEIGDDHDMREWAMHMVLLARALERMGDMTVDIGEHTAFVVTGLFREFQDASHPELVRPVGLGRGAPDG